VFRTRLSWFVGDVPDGRLGDKISQEISKEFPDPVFLEFERVLFPSLLVNRKVPSVSGV
jgi:hypothetical protein